MSHFFIGIELALLAGIGAFFAVEGVLGFIFLFAYSLYRVISSKRK